MTYTSSKLRQAFLEFFAARGHEIVPSSSLVPAKDPTLLFTNAGMVQFKDAFLGAERRKNPRAVTAQRCVRAGGKHNDLENVGYTARHHTFFEMLGNFSFGDYFKREAIGFAWEFVTETLRLPPEKLWCTVFDEDDEAAGIWLDEIGVDPSRFSRLGKKDNFWAMGDTGPCGPCSEIFYDHGSEIAGGPPGSADDAGDRYVEIWNLVFMQFDRSAEGRLTPLPKPSVDTGMGLERLAAVMQGVHSNYEIDLFARLIRDAAQLTGAADLSSKSLRVIADHIRACAFLIADGVLPGNEGRGYVLRRIIRRALRHGHKLGVEGPFFYKLVASLEAVMGAAYPELGQRRDHVERVLLQEEQRFADTLALGMSLLEDAIAGLPSGGEIPGDTVFKLYDTYGFPEDLTADVARERGLTIDGAGFETAMAAQRQRARDASRFGSVADSDELLREANKDLARRELEATEFLGYESTQSDAAVVGLFDAQGAPTERLDAGRHGLVILDRTPFYAESGGQVGDIGTLSRSDAARFVVTDTRKLGEWHAHIGFVESGTIGTGELVRASIDADRRAAIVLNHSATHLLHAALRTVLGEHVQQKGSLVAADRLRFDFAHFEPVGAEQLQRIEALVNEQIRTNDEAETRVMTYDDAISAGALAFFGDKYGEHVRVLRIGAYSTELCGGTHVGRAGDIGLLKITSESGIAAGVRRIEAVTGGAALAWIETTEAVVREVANLLRSGRDDVAAKVAQLIERTRHLERENHALKAKLASGESRDLLDDVEEINGIRLLVARLDGVDTKALRDTCDRLKDKLGSGVVVLGAEEAGKVRLVVGVTRDLTGSISAGELIRPIAEHVGGKGGGRPDFAQAGGSLPGRLDEALQLAREQL